MRDIAVHPSYMLRRVLADLLAGGFLVPSIEFALGLSSHVCCAEVEGWAGFDRLACLTPF